MLCKQRSTDNSPLRKTMNDMYRCHERDILTLLIDQARLDNHLADITQSFAKELVEHVRGGRKKSLGIDSFLTEYALSSEEGIALMCLAEALLRVPDNPTIDGLIKDKIAGANWGSHQGQSDSFFINATTWALMLTGKVLAPEKAPSRLGKSLISMVNKSGEGVVRKAADKAMRIMSKQFVMGRTIEEALQRAQKREALGYRYSYDMLGEAALTEKDALRYLKAYEDAIIAIGSASVSDKPTHQKPGISIKLSALHPRYTEAKRIRVLEELVPKLLGLAKLAKTHNIGLTIDAEESERLDLSLDVIEQVFIDESLNGWTGFGMAVQSYQKRAFYLLDWIADLAKKTQRRMAVRLIKGAYWDSEIKKSQMQGLDDYPVFTRKVFTDVSFQACAKKILTLTDYIYPQFATHNAYTVSMVINLAKDYRDFEFQCLHGMGKELYEYVVQTLGIPCRVYAPVGSYEDLLPYLVRRLLENGANSSFVNRIVDEKTPISSLIEDPVQKAELWLDKINQNIVLPADIFMPERKNSQGIDWSNRATVYQMQLSFSDISPLNWRATPLVAHKLFGNAPNHAVCSPQCTQTVIGHVSYANSNDVQDALGHAEKAFFEWQKTSVKDRASYITNFADLLEQQTVKFLALLCLEAGKTMADAIAEIREAVDFCRYYAVQAKKIMSKPIYLQGYTGETNALSLHPRGVVLCISPWNFPLAIFVGQVVAGLLTGNCVVAKPAEQTSLVAYAAVELMLQAGIPPTVLQLLPGIGSCVGEMLVNDPRIKAVVFTGSSQTAQLIHQNLAKREEIIPLIAETGGQNAMIVDSSALLEQVTLDVIQSAFGSAGQRCSALRVLYVQDEVYPRMTALLKGAMDELTLGDPRWLETDVGPVIDEEALGKLVDHLKKMSGKYDIIHQSVLPESCKSGYFMPPTAIAIDSIKSLENEVFGPILHVISYQRDQLDAIIDDINQTRYGLTLGIHSRINSTVEYITQRVHVGNCYVNRNMVGAVVGLQPFGGEGLSGTGPKAGGPHYLQRLCVERTLTIDTTAAGGNATLMSLEE